MKNNTKRSRIVLLLLTYFFLGACSSGDETRVFEEYVNFDDMLWSKDEPIQIDFEITNTTDKHFLFYGVRYTNAFPFHNLFLQYQLTDSAGSVLSENLHEMNLFDPVSGEPLGNGQGDLFDLRVLTLENYVFPYKGKYAMKVKQYMRRDTLSDIAAIGLRIDRMQ